MTNKLVRHLKKLILPIYISSVCQLHYESFSFSSLGYQNNSKETCNFTGSVVVTYSCSMLQDPSFAGDVWVQFTTTQYAEDG